MNSKKLFSYQLPSTISIYSVSIIFKPSLRYNSNKFDELKSPEENSNCSNLKYSLQICFPLGPQKLKAQF